MMPLDNSFGALSSPQREACCTCKFFCGANTYKAMAVLSAICLRYGLQRRDSSEFGCRRGVECPVWRHRRQRSDERAALANGCCASKYPNGQRQLSPQLTSSCAAQRTAVFPEPVTDDQRSEGARRGQSRNGLEPMLVDAETQTMKLTHLSERPPNYFFEQRPDTRWLS